MDTAGYLLSTLMLATLIFVGVASGFGLSSTFKWVGIMLCLSSEMGRWLQINDPEDKVEYGMLRVGSTLMIASFATS